MCGEGHNLKQKRPTCAKLGSLFFPRTGSHSRGRAELKSTHYGNETCSTKPGKGNWKSAKENIELETKVSLLLFSCELSSQ